MSKGRPVDQVPLYYAHSQLHTSSFLENSQSDEVPLFDHSLTAIQISKKPEPKARKLKSDKNLCSKLYGHIEWLYHMYHIITYNF